MKISKHITYAEAIHSNTAKRKCIDNTPNPQQLENMKTTAEMVFEPLRGWVNGPIKVSSFFRSPDLNQAIGGVASSQHCKGQALDLDDVYGYKTNAEMFTIYPGSGSSSSILMKLASKKVGSMASRNHGISPSPEAGMNNFRILATTWAWPGTFLKPTYHEAGKMSESSST